MKRIFSYFLTIFMISVLLISSVYAAKQYPDVKSDYWAYNYIAYLSDKGILDGYPDGTFGPTDNVTREQFIKMMVETFGLKEKATLNYSDVSSATWSYEYIQKAKAQGFLLDYGTQLSPTKTLTREEAAALLARYLNLSEKVSTSFYSDYTSIDPSYRDYVLQATQAGLFTGYTDGQFKPKNILSRAEALTILYRAAGEIFSSNSSGNDYYASSKNAVINKSGVTVSSSYLEGNVYITEGTSDGKVVLNGVNINGTLYIRSSGEITLTDCIILDIVVEPAGTSMPTINIYGSSTVYNLKLLKTANTIIDSKATVSEMTVTNNAVNSKITGTGKISSLKVQTSGVNSSIIPANYTIDSSYTAFFGGIEYSKDGPVVLGTGFVNGYPYMEKLSDGYTEVIFKTEKIGKVYYTLVSKNNATPAASTIKSSGSVYNVTSVKEIALDINRVYTNFDNYDLVIVYYNDSGVAYEPVRVIKSEDSGFSSASVRGSTSGSTYTATYTLTSQIPGKAYIVAYRPDSTALLTESRIISGASAAGTQYMVGGILDMPKAGTIYTYNLDIPSSYLTYGWETAIVFVSSTGVQQAASYAGITAYKEDITSVRPIQGNGFLTDPVLQLGVYPESSYDRISFKTEKDGRLYYYYTNTSTVPDAQGFSTNYNSTTTLYKSYMSVAGGTSYSAQNLSYAKTAVASYNYIVLAYADNNGNFYAPVIISRGAATGFASTPTFGGSSGGYDYILCTPSKSGTILYYYTTSGTTPTSTEFLNNYFNAAANGQRSVTASSSAASVSMSLSTSSGTYIVIMLTDDSGYYQPVVISRSNSGSSTITGFTAGPVFGSTGALEYVQYASSYIGGYISYYYTSSSTTPTSSSFGTNYNNATYRGLDSITSTGLSYLYLQSGTGTNVVVMITDSLGNNYQPVLIQRSGSGSIASTGFTAGPVYGTSGSLEYLQYASSISSGTISYYYTSSSTAPTSSTFSANYTSATYKGSDSITSTSLSYSFLLNGTGSYIAVMITDSLGNNYQPVVVSRTSGSGNSASTGFLITPTSTLNNNGYDYITGAVAESGGTIYYYYTSSSTTPTVTEFSQGGTILSNSVLTSTFTFTSLASSYPKNPYQYIAMLYIGPSGTVYNPIVITRN